MPYQRVNCMLTNVCSGPGFMLCDRPLFGKAIVFMCRIKDNMELDMNREDLNAVQWLTEDEVSNV